jgi:hypothetical protein
VSAERKKSHRQGKHGIIVASFGKISDKRKEMEKNSQLKDSRNYKDIFIEHSIPKNQRMLNSSLRNIVQAIGDNKLEIKGTIVKPKIQLLMFQSTHSTYLRPRRLFCIKH